MNKELKYGGYTASPGDREAPEGDLSVAMNLIPEHSTIRPVLPPKVKFSLPTGATLMCIHKTANYTNYIYHQEGNESLYRLDENGNPPYDGGHIHTFAGVDVYKVEPIGNTLVVIASDGVHYILNKNGVYHYLGTHIPELDLTFELIDGKEFGSDEHRVDWDLSGLDIEEGDETPIWWFDDDKQYSSDASVGKEVGAKLRQGIMASLNEAVADACIDKHFVFPLFVRYGFRMYDGSVTMHSAPALLIPTLEPPSLDMGWEISHDRQWVTNPAKIKASVTGYQLYCKPLYTAQVDSLNDWSDIVSSVDIFISPQFYTYNQGAKDREIVLEASPRPPRNTRFASQVCENGTFYLLKQVRLSSTSQPLQPAGGYITPDFEPTNDNIVVRELMSDDYGTHEGLLADKSYSFNGRINLAGVSKTLFNGYNPACMWRKVGDTASNTTTATVVVEADSREITVQSPPGMVYYTNRADRKVWWFYYPHAGGKKAYLTIDGQDIELTLTAHPILNGAYYCALDEDAAERTAAFIPAPSSDEQRVVEQPNKVYTSEVNNPFYFPATGINSVGTGEIVGICAAVKAMSQGQFGQFPLYAFTTDGVWALQTNEQGGYSAVQPVTRDVCVNAESITQLDDSVLFTTTRGIMLISGSQVQCISTDIDDDGQQIFDVHAIWNGEAVSNLTGISDQELTISPFCDFLGGCRMLYDYAGQRIVAYNPSFSYAYVYSLESKKWGMTQSDVDYSINSYPDALAVTRHGNLVDYSEPAEPDEVSAILLTRPLALDLPDVLKTVTAIIQRGTFDHHDRTRNPVNVAVYASPDLYNWFYIGSSRDHYWRGFRGTPYKWFRVGLLLHLKPGESVTGCSVQYDPRQTNRLR